MKRRAFIAAIVPVLVAAGMLLSGCNALFTVRESGPLATRDYDFADFSALHVGSAFRVEVSRADTYSVRITTHENLFKDVKVTKAGSTLEIGLDWPSLFLGPRTLEAKITMPELTGLQLSGASKGTVTGFKSDRDLEARVSGASGLNLDAETGRFASEISGSSEVKAKVKSSAADVRLSGASSLSLDMETGDFLLDLSGASEAEGSVRASGSTIRLTGASEASVTGSGGDLRLSGSGASEAGLAGFAVGNADVSLSGASRADVDAGGRLDLSLSGASELRYGGNPTLGDRMDISGGSKFERR